jgi:hypothetical protein
VSSGSFGRALQQVPPNGRHAAEVAARAAFVGALNEILLVSTSVAAAGAVCAFVLVRRVELQQQQREPERLAA